MGLADSAYLIKVMALRSSAMNHEQKVWATVAVIGAGLAAIGSLLPWATVNTVFGSFSKNGTAGDGVITLVLALAVACLLGACLAGRTAVALPIVAGAGAAVVVAVAGYDLLDAAHRLSALNAEAGGYANGSVGGGLYLTVIGGLAALIGSIPLAWRAQPDPLLEAWSKPASPPSMSDPPATR